jgi:hypothetical protein
VSVLGLVAKIGFGQLYGIQWCWAGQYKRVLFLLFVFLYSSSRQLVVCLEGMDVLASHQAEIGSRVGSEFVVISLGEQASVPGPVSCGLPGRLGYLGKWRRRIRTRGADEVGVLDWTGPVCGCAGFSLIGKPGFLVGGRWHWGQGGVWVVGVVDLTHAHPPLLPLRRPPPSSEIDQG